MWKLRLKWNLTAEVKYRKEFAAVGHREEVSIANCGSCDHQVPEGVAKPERTLGRNTNNWTRIPPDFYLFQSIFMVVPEVAWVFEELDESGGPEYEGNDHGEELGEADGGGVGEDVGEGEHVGQVVEHQEAEEAETKPGPAQPDGEEEGGKGEHVDDRVEREHLGQERLCCHQP